MSESGSGFRMPLYCSKSGGNRTSAIGEQAIFLFPALSLSRAERLQHVREREKGWGRVGRVTIENVPAELSQSGWLPARERAINLRTPLCLCLQSLMFPNAHTEKSSAAAAAS